MLRIEAFPRWLAALFFLRTVDRCFVCTSDFSPFERAMGMSRIDRLNGSLQGRRRRRRRKTKKRRRTLINLALRDVETQDHRSSRGVGGRAKGEKGGGERGHNLRYEIINRTVYVYSICVRMYLYIVRPQGAAVWHNHDLKSDHLISCIRIYVVYTSPPFSFLPHYATPATNV